MHFLHFFVFSLLRTVFCDQLLPDFEQLPTSTLDLTLLGCSNVSKTIANRSGGFEIGQRDTKNGISKFRFFQHFPIFRGWGAGGPWRGSGQGARVELFHFCLNCFLFAFPRLISRNIIRIDFPHAGVTPGMVRGAPGGPWGPQGPAS